MWPTLAVIVVLVLLAGWLLTRGSIYKIIFSDAHLLAVAQKIPGLKKAALEKIVSEEEPQVQSREDPRVLLSEAGILMVYSISSESPVEYVHHVSVSLAGQYTAGAVGTTFVCLWAKVLGIDLARLKLGVSKATVHHAEFVLSEAEQAEFARQGLSAPDRTWLDAFRREWSEIGARLKFQPLDVTPA